VVITTGASVNQTALSKYAAIKWLPVVCENSNAFSPHDLERHDADQPEFVNRPTRPPSRTSPSTKRPTENQRTESRREIGLDRTGESPARPSLPPTREPTPKACIPISMCHLGIWKDPSGHHRRGLRQSNRGSSVRQKRNGSPDRTVFERLYESVRDRGARLRP